MNERIKELLLKVVHMQGEDGEYLPSLVTEEHIEKFAELIVKEVIAVYNHDGFQTPSEQDYLVLKHFGVK